MRKHLAGGHGLLGVNGGRTTKQPLKLAAFAGALAAELGVTLGADELRAVAVAFPHPAGDGCVDARAFHRSLLLSSRGHGARPFTSPEGFKKKKKALTADSLALNAAQV